jgi:spore coat protein U-like protein
MHTKSILTASLSVLAGLAMLPGAADAATTNTATGTLQATITITSNCAVSASNAALDFGSKASTTAGASASNGGFSVTCTNQTPYNVGLAGSSGASDGTGTMTFGSNTIGYQLYQDAGQKTPWGNTVGTNTQTATGNGSSQPYTVYGKTTTSLNVPAGAYKDTVAINVTY